MPAQSAEQLWKAYNETTDTNGASYQTRWFGEQNNPAEVQAFADAILAGTKTATTTPLDTYTAEQVAIPQVGDYNVLLDGNMKPAAVLKTVVSELIPFYRISGEHAYHEGDGDRSIGDWRKRKTEEFTPVLEEHGQNLSPDTPMVSEVFEVVYRNN
ncbi:ASCH domain-containing protein [Lactiplantibacillus fabifermentans]|uniref:ASCH domain protein n=2 Tax=Lactiplantibacillus fabifermentans TaxID=483011 RepID=A0A0R2NJC2_9LACO|nr:ASCH domain-containing protein [Lactiplantibacillus fabifermentans]ETY75468.1 RNA-binding protein [Lactiplantibacillus fabifermentans T30PCM01]KRO24699.1 ASCH domain protein [Lactiplantibacillus fabifermentans DSM 21115]